MFYQQVRYTLIDGVNPDYQLKYDPKNWKEQERKNSRSATQLGFTMKYSDGVILVKEDAERIGYIIRTLGKKAKVKFRRDEKNPYTDEWVLGYENYINLPKISQEGQEITIEFKEVGLKTTVDDFFKETFELDREYDLKGNYIGSLDYVKMNNYGRNVFLESKVSNDLLNFRSAGFFVLDQVIRFESDNDVQNVINTDVFKTVTQNTNGDVFLDVNQVFFKANETKTFKILIDAKVTFTTPNSFVNVKLLQLFNDNGKYRANFNNDGATLAYSTSHNGELKISYNETITVNENIALAVVFSSGKQQIKVAENNFSILIQEDSSFETTSNEGLMLPDAIDRALHIITGKKGLLLNGMPENSIFSNFLISSGLQIRMFPRIDRERIIDINALEPPQPVIESTIKTSLSDLLSFKAYEPIAWGVVDDMFVIKSFKDFFNNDNGLVLKDNTTPIRTFALDFIYSKIRIGNEEAGKYEEIVGLYEYNALSEWVTIEESVDNELELISKIRVDAIKAEIMRRANIQYKPTEDTDADYHVFGFHVKTDTDGNYTPRLWRDNLGVSPQVYDPESAYNLILSPANCLKRWSFLIATGLKNYPHDYVRFINSTGYDKMVTKQIGKDAIIENQDFKNGKLDDPIFKDEYIECETVLSFDEQQSMNEIKFMEKRVFLQKTGEYGFVLDSTIKEGRGIFKLIKAI